MLPLLCYDVIFKALFINQENILAKMIADITGMDYKLLEDNIVMITNEIPIDNKDEKFKRCDFILRMNNNNIINLELNRQSHSGLIVKNLVYLFQLFSASFKKGDEYDSELVIMQININCFMNNIGITKPINKYKILDEDGQSYTDNVVIYDLNVVKCHELYYNNSSEKVPNYVRWGAFIYCDDFFKIPDIVKGIMTKKEIEVIMDKINNITNDDLFMTKAEMLHWEEWEKNTLYNDGKKEGFNDGKEQGIEQGIEQMVYLTIKNMIKEKFTLEDISKVTGKSIDDIKKYIEE